MRTPDEIAKDDADLTVLKACIAKIVSAGMMTMLEQQHGVAPGATTRILQRLDTLQRIADLHHQVVHDLFRTASPPQLRSALDALFDDPAEADAVYDQILRERGDPPDGNPAARATRRLLSPAAANPRRPDRRVRFSHQIAPKTPIPLTKPAIPHPSSSTHPKTPTKVFEN